MFLKKSRFKSRMLTALIVVLILSSLTLPTYAANRAYVFSFSDIHYTYRTVDVPERILPYMWSMNYDAGEYLNNSVASAYSVISNCKAFVFLGDGVPGWVKFINSSGVFSDLYATKSNLDSTERALSNLSAGALTGTRTVIFLATFTGRTHETYGNLVDMAVSKGAQTSIGWISSVDSTNEGADWIESFFKYSAEGDAVNIALSLADLEMRTLLPNDLYNKVNNRHTSGSLNTYLRIST